MDHQSQAHSKRKSDVDRKLRADKRTKLSNEAWEQRDLCNDEYVQGDEERACQGIEEGCATQTDPTMSTLATKLEQFEFASKK
ncbi:hypothetical protein JTB14_008693 [Gonioctena quinquepunctata]|nr:hypothetical protein JTB14_008693 [Gonioctena quinquepunctata]